MRKRHPDLRTHITAQGRILFGFAEIQIVRAYASILVGPAQNLTVHFAEI